MEVFPIPVSGGTARCGSPGDLCRTPPGAPASPLHNTSMSSSQTMPSCFLTRNKRQPTQRGVSVPRPLADHCWTTFLVVELVGAGHLVGVGEVVVVGQRSKVLCWCLLLFKLCVATVCMHLSFFDFICRMYFVYMIL